MTHISTPTLFLPGTQCDERVWMPLWRELDLAQRSYVPLQWAESLEHMLALTQDRIDTYPEKVNLVGFSMGGYIASLAALQNPSRVASLTLIGYHPKGLDQGELQKRKLLLATLNKQKKAPLTQARLRAYLTDSELTQTEIVEVLQQMDQDLGTAVLKAHITATTPRQDLSLPLSQCSFPVHYICAQHDQIANANDIERYAKTNKNSDYMCLKDTAHMMLLTQPQHIAKHLQPCLLG
ncbi:alpha/beta hydrolase [Aliiglaciecola litoralis]|uniref:Alpha/beta hydrolase n=1 Tax=Aliiglaciecola litoralis TaxID=582857 RepID=A0ABN1LIP9_9ALTE